MFYIFNDLASGQVYEYNTKTNARQWIKTNEGNPVKVTIGQDQPALDV